MRSFHDAYQDNVDMLFRVCFSYMKNVAEAEDVVADVFVKLLSVNKKFDSTEHEKAWLLRASINLCKDRLKHWWQGRVDIDECDFLKSKDEISGDETLKAILQLPERYKGVIYLYYYEGYSSAEIAQMLKKPRSTILNHLSEARKVLKGVLEDEQKCCGRLEQDKPKRGRKKTDAKQNLRKTGNA